VRFVAVGDVMVDVVADRLPVSDERADGSVRLRAGGSAVFSARACRSVISMSHLGFVLSR
jgi:sugar/nucleoside kinase (ribokinase family)